jgi:hypothetical protein
MISQHGGSQGGAEFPRAHIQPEWLIPQFRHHALKDRTDHYVKREGKVNSRCFAQS